MGYSFTPLGLTHFASALVAMVCAALILLRTKGTRWHVATGYTYVVAMIVLNLTALMIYRLLGTFGPFHIAALISFASVVGGLVPAILRKPRGGWLEMHYEFMCWSAVGLFAAFWSETMSRFFRFAGFWVIVATATLMTVAIGAWLLKSRKRSTLARYG